MQSILRNVNQAVKGMATRIPGLARRKELLLQPPRLLLRRTSTQQQPHQPIRDLGVANSSWSPEMMVQFQKFTKMSEDGSWQRILSYNCLASMTASAEEHQKRDSQNGERRLFVQSIGEEGMGFEHAVFINPSEARAVTLFQPGPCLEGPVGDPPVKISRMQSILRNVNQAVKEMATRIPGLARRKELLVQPPRLLLRRTSTQQQQPHQPIKDLGVPNSSWSPEMMGQFQKFTKMSEDGSWQRIPSHNSCVDSMPVRSKSEYNPRKQKDACLFVRSVAAEGRGFEFAMFYNEAERQMVVLLQPGSYLEGMIGFMHGGAVAAILDHTFASCGIYAFGIVVTASLSVNFKSPIPLGSVVLVETKVEKVEENKIFLSGFVRSTDAQNLHAEATALLVHLDTKTSSHPVTSSG